MKETNHYPNTQHASETSLTQSTQSKSHSSKRVDIVSLRMVKETSCAPYTSDAILTIR
ncbi:hypothetical protein [Sporosarcina sp. SAFN-010]|uniref:hypothetical protein n=1 Tax=Sporosarcina sp. SAFN-010 TaxID=3387273 RepID=UPI003F7CED66